MRLEVITPMAVSVDAAARRIVCEGPDGHFGILPRHADLVAQLVPGVLTYETEEGVERFVAVNAGTLVKCGDTVSVAVRGAIVGDDLGALRARVETEFRARDEAERDARAALARLEAGMVRRLRDLQAT